MPVRSGTKDSGGGDKRWPRYGKVGGPDRPAAADSWPPFGPGPVARLAGSLRNEDRHFALTRWRHRSFGAFARCLAGLAGQRPSMARSEIWGRAFDAACVVVVVVVPSLGVDQTVKFS